MYLDVKPRGHATMNHVDLTDLMPLPKDERTQWRRFADLDVELRGATGNTYAATLGNLSENGCMLTLGYGDRLKRERLVGFKLGHEHHAIGRVVWTRENVLGLRFLAPVPTSVVEQVTFASLSRRLAQARLPFNPIEDLPPPTSQVLKLTREPAET